MWLRQEENSPGGLILSCNTESHGPGTVMERIWALGKICRMTLSCLDSDLVKWRCELLSWEHTRKSQDYLHRSVFTSKIGWEVVLVAPNVRLLQDQLVYEAWRIVELAADRDRSL
ncbi:hypothetical protein MC885_008744 [Smutsia gigantea]|nr:hypothetical protein MC885_008744 [Smutsia gigantea]